METLPKNKLLKFHPDTLYAVRAACNLETPGRLDEAVDLLQDWIHKQRHFIKKEYPRRYLDAVLITTKGSLEKAKRRIDKMCTMRTFQSQIFDKVDANNDFMELHDIIKTISLPELTEDHYRITIVKPTGHQLPPSYNHLDFFRFCIIMSEYFKLHDYCQGFIIILDHRDASVMDFAGKINLFDLRNVLSLMIDGYGVRIKNLHFLTPSKMIDTLVGISKQVLSAKISSRIKVHKTIDTLYEFVPKTLLPKDLGGDQRSISTIYEEWRQELSTKEHIAHIKMMKDARTDEKLRLTEKFDEGLGISGTFRTLTFD